MTDKNLFGVPVTTSESCPRGSAYIFGAPPVRADFQTAEEWQQACADWAATVTRMNFDTDDEQGS
jgi:hypothetical protein